LLAACSRLAAPKDPSEYALFRDLERQVTVAATTGWNVDRIEVEKVLNSSLDSVCRVDALGRRNLRTWLDAEINRLGGPVEEAWRARGKDLGAVSDLLVLTRVRLVLARAEELALDCPFWIEPEQPFRGRQISEGHWQLSGGTGGKGSVIRQGDQQDVSFGAAGRLLLGRVFAGGDAIYAGAELGASGQFPRDASGMRLPLQLGADFVTPVVYRHTLTNMYFELEAGWLAHSTEVNWLDFNYGVHVGFAVGARALRQRFLFPGAAIGISYERVFVGGDDLITLKVGARVAFDLDL
jgi:hypothetical protein